MRMRWMALGAMWVTVAGCAPRDKTPPPPEFLPATYAWVPALTAEQAKTLSAEEAKAIVIARAALEEQAKKAGYPPPNLMKITVKASASGWEVFVQYAGVMFNGEMIGMPGGYSTVYIDRSWAVTAIAVPPPRP